MVRHSQGGPVGETHRPPERRDREAGAPHLRDRGNAQPATGGSRFDTAGDRAAGRRPHRAHQARYRGQAHAEGRARAAGHAIRCAREGPGTAGSDRRRDVRRQSARHTRGADGSRGGAGGGAERAHRSRHGAAPVAGAVRRTGSGAAVAVPPAIEHSAADSGNAQRTVPDHRHQRGRHPVRRGVAAGAHGRARVGRRHRTPAAQFRPFPAGARRALRAGGGMGGPDASQRTAGVLPRAQGARGRPRRAARRLAGAQDRDQAGVGLL